MDIQTLEKRIKGLEDIIAGFARDNRFAENVRDIVIFGQDSRAAPVTEISLSGEPEDIEVLAPPDMFLRVYFRGKVYNIPAFNLS